MLILAHGLKGSGPLRGQGLFSQCAIFWARAHFDLCFKALVDRDMVAIGCSITVGNGLWGAFYVTVTATKLVEPVLVP